MVLLLTFIEQQKLSAFFAFFWVGSKVVQGSKVSSNQTEAMHSIHAEFENWLQFKLHQCGFFKPIFWGLTNKSQFSEFKRFSIIDRLLLLLYKKEQFIGRFQRQKVAKYRQSDQVERVVPIHQYRLLVVGARRHELEAIVVLKAFLSRMEHRKFWAVVHFEVALLLFGPKWARFVGGHRPKELGRIFQPFVHNFWSPVFFQSDVFWCCIVMCSYCVV